MIDNITSYVNTIFELLKFVGKVEVKLRGDTGRSDGMRMEVEMVEWDWGAEWKRKIEIG